MATLCPEVSPPSLDQPTERLVGSLELRNPAEIFMINPAETPVSTWWHKGVLEERLGTYHTLTAQGQEPETALQETNCAFARGVVRSLLSHWETSQEPTTYFELAKLVPLPDDLVPVALSEARDLLCNRILHQDDAQAAAQLFAALCCHALDNAGTPQERSIPDGPVFKLKIDLLSEAPLTDDERDRAFGIAFGVKPVQEPPHDPRQSGAVLPTAALLAVALTANPAAATDLPPQTTKNIALAPAKGLVVPTNQAPAAGSANIPRPTVELSPYVEVIDQAPQAPHKLLDGTQINPSPGIVQAVTSADIVPPGQDPLEVSGGTTVKTIEVDNSNADRVPLSASNYNLATVVENVVSSLNNSLTLQQPSPPRADAATRLATILKEAVQNPNSLSEEISLTELLFSGSKGLDARLVYEEMDKIIREFGTRDYFFVSHDGTNGKQYYWQGMTARQSSLLASLLAVARLSTFDQETIQKRLAALPVEKPTKSPKTDRQNTNQPGSTTKPAGEKSSEDHLTEAILKTYYNSPYLENIKTYIPLYIKYGKEFDIPPELLAAQEFIESSFNHEVVNGIEAAGLGQFMPGTIEYMKGKASGVPENFDIFNPEHAIWAHAWLFDDYRKILINAEVSNDPETLIELTLAAYYSGPGTVIKARGMPANGKDGIRDYVGKIMNQVAKIHHGIDLQGQIASRNETRGPTDELQAREFPTRAKVTASETAAKTECERLGIDYLGTAVGHKDGKEMTVYLCRIPNKYSYGKPREVSVVIAARVLALLEEMHKAGFNVSLNSDFRTNEEQIEARRVNQCGAPENPAESCLVDPVARPDYSIHESGEAIDVGVEGVLIRERGTPIQKLLIKLAHLFGLEDIPSEAWHIQLPRGDG
ncbi:transglycosylase SLT domain-containing protein [Candidatus Saccharibacteria bacterium]|nr:transglycosylase SLT domain-containing protein [Candidatus Saccharibacteria bacterium]